MHGQAIIHYGQPLGPITLDERPLGPTETLVRVTSCGVCHSDLHIQDGYFNMGADAAAVKMSEGLLPLIPGHEIEGVIEALGQEVQSRNPDLKPGLRVAVYPWIGCQNCPACSTGDQHLCEAGQSLGTVVHGGFADHVRVAIPEALIPCGDLAPGVGGLAMCSGLTALSAVRKLDRLAPSDAILLVGLGGVGLAALSIAKALHDGPVIAADVNPAARATALERGADAAVDPADREAVKALRKQFSIGGAVDFVGAPATLGFGIGAVRKGGQVVVVGLFGGALSLSIPLLPFKALTICGSYVGSLAEARELIGLIREGRLPAPIMAMRPLAEANAALDQLRAGGHIGRTVLCP